MDVESQVSALRAALRRIGPAAFVPTMGNLHEGHLSLVRRAKATGLPVVASIFVNPLQFAPEEDFTSYPRTLDDDLAGLEKEGVALVFTPGEQELYPAPQTWTVQPAAELGEILEGAYRPGFFTGVATVVLKLFNLVQPSVAVFGKKDYQQLLVIRAMCRQFALPIEILAGETVREPDGLALSSRNGYLSEAARAKAPELRQSLLALAAKVSAGEDDPAKLEQQAAASLSARGWEVDYIAVRQQADLKPVPAGGDLGHTPAVILGAAHLSRTRLIDNLEIEAS